MLRHVFFAGRGAKHCHSGIAVGFVKIILLRPSTPSCVGIRIIEEAWRTLPDDVKCFLRAAEVAHGTSNFVDLAGARAMSVAEVACLVGLFGPMYAASVARATCLKPIPENGRLDGFMGRVSKEAKAIIVPRTTPSSLKKYLESPVFGPRPRLVAVGSAAALAEASMAAAVEQAAARLADLERKAAFFDAAVVGRPARPGPCDGGAVRRPCP